MRAKRKGVLVILDGLGDRSCGALGGLTPLEAAATPNMDRLAAAGAVGLVDPLYPGLPVSTPTGTATLLGLPPREAAVLPRGPVEAAGIGLAAQPGDVLLRCNFATLIEAPGGIEIANRRAGRIAAGTDRLAAALEEIDTIDGVRVRLRPASQHRAVLWLAGDDLSPAIGATDPMSAGPGVIPLPCRALAPEDRAARRTAAVVNRYLEAAHRLLADHPLNAERRARGEPPANGLLCRSAGTVQHLGGLRRRLGLSGAVVAGESSVLGLARLLGYTAITEPGFTALAGTDLAGKVRAARRALDAHDLVVLHVKAPDICAHDREPLAKARSLEAFDRALLPLIDEGLVLAITGDHSTDSNSGHHCGDPVPTLLYSPLGRRDAVEQFGERQCCGGALGRLPAFGLHSSLLDAMGHLSKAFASDPLVQGLFR